jgi:hypothetical protein
MELLIAEGAVGDEELTQRKFDALAKALKQPCAALAPPRAPSEPSEAAWRAYFDMFGFIGTDAPALSTREYGLFKAALLAAYAVDSVARPPRAGPWLNLAEEWEKEADALDAEKDMLLSNRAGDEVRTHYEIRKRQLRDCAAALRLAAGGAPGEPNE